MVAKIDYEELCKKIDRLADEIKELQRTVHQLSSSEKEAEEAWGNLMKLADEVSARWQGPDAVEEISGQRSKAL